MRIVEEIAVITPTLGRSPGIERALSEVREAVAQVVWPPGSDRFTIYPESGKRRGEGNGVVPIKSAFVAHLSMLGWEPERRIRFESGEARLGAVDLQKRIDGETILVEWETGNVSSSHRAINKLILALSAGAASAGVLVVPSRGLARYLTDRIGNIGELRPYIELWSAIPISEGSLEIWVVEHDDESLDVPRIAKATDGRALS